ncbi:unnamed protein product [Lampetra fluviatilis]
MWTTLDRFSIPLNLLGSRSSSRSSSRGCGGVVDAAALTGCGERVPPPQQGQGAQEQRAVGRVVGHGALRRLRTDRAGGEGERERDNRGNAEPADVAEVPLDATSVREEEEDEDEERAPVVSDTRSVRCCLSSASAPRAAREAKIRRRCRCCCFFKDERGELRRLQQVWERDGVGSCVSVGSACFVVSKVGTGREARGALGRVGA